MSVKVTQLPNGLRIATDRMDHIETVSLGVWFGVGTRNETNGNNGIAHLLEHMAFKGTRRRSAQDIAAEIEAVGGHLNAYTSREQTAYFAKVLCEDLPLAIDILADILQHSVFDPSELEREREVILQEIGQCHDTPDDIVFDLFQEAAFPDQPLGWSVLGSASTVRRLQAGEVRDYMARNYSADKAVVSAAGKVDHDAFVAAVTEAFSEIEDREVEGWAGAGYSGGIRLDQRDLEQVHMIAGYDAVAFDDRDFYPLSVYSTMVGGGMSSRLFQEVRERRGLVYSIYSFSSAYVDGGLFGVYAGTGPEHVEELTEIVGRELRAAGQPNDDELARARAQLKASLLMARESSNARCEQLAQQILIFGRPLTPEEIVAEVEGVDKPRIGALVERLTQSRPTFAGIGPLDGLPVEALGPVGPGAGTGEVPQGAAG